MGTREHALGGTRGQPAFSLPLVIAALGWDDHRMVR